MKRTGCVPSKRQLEFLDWEFGVFFHFGIRTFYEGHRDWDMKEMPLSGFNPTDFSAEDWCRAASESGAKYAIMTAKHHDGFANWPSEYTEYSIKNTPWRDGKGDVVAEFVAACRRFDLKVGLYYSPAQFGSVSMSPDEYNDYFINQIGELLTNYGKIDYLWFDGCGSEGHSYDEKRVVAAIRSYQPEILIFNMWDPDTRWCGNEAGYASYPHFYERDISSVSGFGRPGDSAEGMRFLPEECDCRIRDMWFYGDEDKDRLKSLDVLMGMYELSVGRGANLLLNIGPDRRGRLPEEDKVRLSELGAEIRRRYAYPIQADVRTGEGYVQLAFDGEHELDCIIIEEDITFGQSVCEFDIELCYGGGDSGYTPYKIFCGSTVGRKMICRFPTVRSDSVRVNIRKSDGEYRILSVSAHKC